MIKSKINSGRFKVNFAFAGLNTWKKHTAIKPKAEDLKKIEASQ